MKPGLWLLLIGLCGPWSFAQNETRPEATPRFQLGFYPSDLVVSLVSVDGGVHLHRRHVAGMALGLATASNLEELEKFNSFSSGFVLRPYHKYYLESKPQGARAYLRHGPRFSRFRYAYRSPEWVPFQRNGLTFLRYDTVARSESSLNLGYDLIVGTEQTAGAFFWDVFAGLGFRKALREDELDISIEEAQTEMLQVSHQEDIIFIIGVRLGIQF